MNTNTHHAATHTRDQHRSIIARQAAKKVTTFSRIMALKEELETFHNESTNGKEFAAALAAADDALKTLARFF